MTEIAGGEIVPGMVDAHVREIEHKVVETEAVVPREDLVSVSNYLTESFAGLGMARRITPSAAERFRPLGV